MISGFSNLHLSGYHCPICCRHNSCSTSSKNKEKLLYRCHSFTMIEFCCLFIKFPWWKFQQNLVIPRCKTPCFPTSQHGGKPREAQTNWITFFPLFICRAQFRLLHCHRDQKARMPKVKKHGLPGKTWFTQFVPLSPDKRKKLIKLSLNERKFS